MTTVHMTQLALELRVNALRPWPSEGSHDVGLTFWCSILTGIGKEEMERIVNYFQEKISCLAYLPTIVLKKWLVEGHSRAVCNLIQPFRLTLESLVSSKSVLNHSVSPCDVTLLHVVKSEL